MSRVLLTAFEPYEPWSANASWLALAELLRGLEISLDITTRLYPVELESMKDKLAADMKTHYDFAFHLGQSPGATCIHLEEFAVNVVTQCKSFDEQATAVRCIDESGPAAYRSQLPLRMYADAMREAGIPTCVSQHAGTYLCNAIFYWSHQLISDLDLPTKTAFIHIPLETSQVLALDKPTAFMPKEMAANGLSVILKLLESETKSLA